MTTWRVTCVYVIEAAEVKRVKIGRAIDPNARMMEMRCGSPALLVLHGGVRFRIGVEAALVERKAHARLHCCRSHGEWFDLGAEAAMQAVCAAADELGLAYQTWKESPRLSTVHERRDAQVRELLQSEQALELCHRDIA